MRGGRTIESLEQLQPQLKYLLIDINHKNYDVNKNSISALFFKMDSTKDIDILLDTYNNIVKKLEEKNYNDIKETFKLMMIASILPRIMFSKDQIKIADNLNLKGVGGMLNIYFEEWTKKNKNKWYDKGVQDGMKSAPPDVWDKSEKATLDNVRKKLQKKGFSQEEISSLLA